MIDEHGAGSAEAIVWLADHPEFHEWAISTEQLGAGTDRNIAVQRLTVQWRDTTEQYEALPEDRDVRRQFRLDNPDWADDQWRIEALKQGTNDEPTPEPLVEGMVERGRIVDRHGGGSSEALIWLADNPDFHDWAIETELLTDDGSEWNVPVLRLTAKHRELDAQYAEIDGDDEDARRAFRMAHPEWSDDQARKTIYGWDPEASMKHVEAHVVYSSMEDEHGASSAEVMLWRADDKTGYNAMREAIPEDEDGLLQPVDLASVPIWRIDAKYRKEDAAYDSIPADSPRRELYLVGKPAYRKDRHRRTAYRQRVAKEHIEGFVKYHELPERGFRRDRFLSNNPDYYNDVWLGTLENGAVDFARIPSEQYDVIYERWPDQMERYYEGIPAAVRLLTGEAQDRERGRLIRELFFRNPGFQKQLYLYEGLGELVPDKALPGYIAYRTVRYEGKPSGWETWYADDRVLRDNPAFYEFLLSKGMDPIYFDLIPLESFERTYNETYLKFRMFGEADADTRYRYRGQHKAFDLEGARIGLWKPHRNRTPRDREGLREAVRALSRKSRRKPEFLGVSGR